MQDLINKISSYNLFNYFFCGILFVILSAAFTSYSFIQEDIIIGIFLYYFIGLVISRVGSLIIEPILKSFSFIRFENYANFVAALKKDPKLDLLSEANNMYRTLVSVCVSVIFLMIYDLITTNSGWMKLYEEYIIVIVLLILFLFSYQKQTNYISKRIRNNLKNHEQNYN